MFLSFIYVDYLMEDKTITTRERKVLFLSSSYTQRFLGQSIIVSCYMSVKIYTVPANFEELWIEFLVSMLRHQWQIKFQLRNNVGL